MVSNTFYLCKNKTNDEKLDLNRYLLDNVYIMHAHTLIKHAVGTAGEIVNVDIEMLLLKTLWVA